MLIYLHFNKKYAIEFHIPFVKGLNFEMKMIFSFLFNANFFCDNVCFHLLKIENYSICKFFDVWILEINLIVNNWSTICKLCSKLDEQVALGKDLPFL